MQALEIFENKRNRNPHKVDIKKYISIWNVTQYESKFIIRKYWSFLGSNFGLDKPRESNLPLQWRANVCADQRNRFSDFGSYVSTINLLNNIETFLD